MHAHSHQLIQDGVSTGVYCCNACRFAYVDKQLADACCTPPKCRHCKVEVVTHSWHTCPACGLAEYVRIEQERFDKATKVTEWGGPVSASGLGGDDCYPSLAAFLTDWDAHLQKEPRPKYVWAAVARPFAVLDVSQVIEFICDDAPEDFIPEALEGYEELGAAIARFNTANEHFKTYEVDFKTAVLLSDL